MRVHDVAEMAQVARVTDATPFRAIEPHRSAFEHNWHMFFAFFRCVRMRQVSEVCLDASGRAVLAIDYGRRRMGLALSDSLGVTARPLAIVERSNRRGDIARLREICRRHAVGKLLVGWPLHLDGSVSEMAREAERFAERLRRDLRLPVELVDRAPPPAGRRTRPLDEVQSSRRRSRALPLSRGGRTAPESVDDLAAAVILRDYLSRARRGSQK